jgi:[ribosomal protein S18]-alanine N-acetyltransferase
MELVDVPQVVAIDHASFALPWSERSYRAELEENPHSHFLVALARREGFWQRLWSAAWPRRRRALAPGTARHVVGYAGFWFIVDEAHISTIAVHPDWRRRGVGEYLLVAVLNRALELQATLATLEVRVSNSAAQSLYRKYYFEEVGRRRRYYSNNGEDALLLTTQLTKSRQEQVREAWSRLSSRFGSDVLCPL